MPVYKVTCAMTTYLMLEVVAENEDEALEKGQEAANNGEMQEEGDTFTSGHIDGWGAADITERTLRQIANLNELIGDGSTDHPAKEERAELLDSLGFPEDVEAREDALDDLFKQYNVDPKE